MARETSPPFLFNHSMRTYLFGALLGKDLAFDHELLFLACILHDLGLTDRYAGEKPFEIEGAEAARKFLGPNPWPPGRPWNRSTECLLLRLVTSLWLGKKLSCCSLLGSRKKLKSGKLCPGPPCPGVYRILAGSSSNGHAIVYLLSGEAAKRRAPSWLWRYRPTANLGGNTQAGQRSPVDRGKPITNSPVNEPALSAGIQRSPFQLSMSRAESRWCVLGFPAGF